MAWKIFYDKKKDKKSETEGSVNSGSTELIKENGNKIAENNQIKKKPEKSPEKIQVIPLGGLAEIGKNMTLFQYRDEIVVVDTGLSFPGEDMLGIDLVIPDFTYLVRNKEKLKGIVITHGHEDHIGGLPYLYREIDEQTPLYASRLALALIKEKMENVNKKTNYKLNEVSARESIKIGKYFEIEFIRVTHSIADAFALAIKTPAGVIIHTGDFKIDLTPVSGNSIDFFRFAKLGEEGVMLLLSDSTNSEVEGTTLSEKKVGESLLQLFEKAENRIIIASFASHVDRVQQIINAAYKTGRKIALDGRSMLKVVDIATKLGYIDLPDKDMIIPLKEIASLPDNEAVLLCTGTQGEPMSALSRIANKMHKHIDVREGDTVLISATPIPGNEKAVYKNINNLLKSKAEVVYQKVEGIHTSGHASKEEQKLMLNLVKPKFFMPVHGEYKHLKKHSETAMEMGIDPKNILISNNGMRVEVCEDYIKNKGKVPSGMTLIDGLGIGDIGNIVLRDRKHLAQDGIVIVIVRISKETGALVSGPEIITRGFVYARESEKMLNETSKKIREELNKEKYKNVKEWSVLKNAIKNAANHFLYEQIMRSPIILPIIMEV